MTRLEFMKICAGAGAAPLEAIGQERDQISIRHGADLQWTAHRGPHGWSFGSFIVAGDPVDKHLDEGALLLRNLFTAEERWLPARSAVRLGPDRAELQGTATVASSTLTFNIQVRLDPDSAAAFITFAWSVDQDLTGWEVCLPCWGAGEHEWRSTMYPFAGNSVELRRDRLSYVGVPAALMFRDDLSLVSLLGIDPALDYFNPATWTGTTGFHFRDLTIPPQFRVCGGKILANTEYRFPVQVLFDRSGDPTNAITAVVKNWIRLNRYEVQPLEVRSPDAALEVYIEGRRRTPMWNPGKGYQIEDAWKAVYVAEIPISAYFDYLVWEATGDRIWHDRAFESADFLPRAQHLDHGDPHYGVIETNYELDTGRFTSADHTPIIGYRVDMNAFAARYLLMLWDRVKRVEGVDRSEWREAAVRMAEWVLKQQNRDGGLPQHVNYHTGRKSISVVSARTLVAMPVIYRLTGRDEFRRLADDLEHFLRERVESRYWFTGQHVDLWPGDFESDSVWCVVEYWLDKYDRTKDPEALRRAEADAWFGFLMWCPKQLPWVRNPTQTCHAEQEHYLQYSNYCYNNRKIECLLRLGKRTGNRLFTELGQRVTNCAIWAQETTGPYQGAQYERISDPWLSVSKDVNSKGELYMSELALDANLQWLEMGLARPRRVKGTSRAYWSAFPAAAILTLIAIVGALAMGDARGDAAIRFEYRPISFAIENCETPAKTVPETMAGGVAVFDFNNDGRPDIFFTNGAEIPSLRKSSPKYSNRLFRNDGNGRFTDVTESAGLRGKGYDTGAAVADYDNDGFKDLFVAGVHGYTLYHNNGDGTFMDVTGRAGISAADSKFGPLWGVGGAWFDYNGDGKLDLFVVNYLRWDPGKEPKCPDYCNPNYYEGTPNRLYRNDGDGRFTDVSAESGIREYVGKGMSASLADMDGDGKLAIFVTNDKQMNYLFRDTGKGRFRDVAAEYGVPLPSYGMPVSGMGSDFRDVDNDGRPDIFFVALQNEGFPLFHNTGKRFFEEVSVTNGLAQLANTMSGYSPAIIDLDNDGWKDLFASCGHVQSIPLSRSMKIDLPNVVFRNRADGRWDALVDQAGFGSQPARRHRGAAFGDFDGDGRVDVVVTALGAPAEIWMNRSPAANHWLDVELVGSTSNRDGIGASLTIATATGKQFNHMTTAAGYASSSAGPVHFGLGGERTVKLLEVRWPGGKVQQFTNVPADRVFRVTEPR